MISLEHELNRKFGDIEEWAKRGDVSLKNYEMRAEWYGILQKWGDKWPYLSNKDDLPDTANRGEWDLYFREHLRGFPVTYQMFRDGAISFWNAPSATPAEFDAAYAAKQTRIGNRHEVA